MVAKLTNQKTLIAKLCDQVISIVKLSNWNYFVTIQIFLGHFPKTFWLLPINVLVIWSIVIPSPPLIQWLFFFGYFLEIFIATQKIWLPIFICQTRWQVIENWTSVVSQFFFMINVEIVFGHYPKNCSYPINND